MESAVFFIGADVVQKPAFGVLNDMNAVFAEKGLAQLGIVFEQGLELAFSQQVFNGNCFAGLRGDQMHFRWNEGIGVFFDFAAQRVEGFRFAAKCR